MTLVELKSICEEVEATATDGLDCLNADELDQQKEVGHEARDLARKDRLRLMKRSRGDNYKTARSIAVNAKADARKADAENTDTPQTHVSNYDTASKMRLT